MSLRTNFWIDFTVFIGFLVALQPRLTGSSLHEWLTLAGAGVLVVHLLIHWDWVTKAIFRFFRDARNIVRLNFVLALLVFVGFTAIITSGLVISRTVVPFFGLPPADDRGWKGIHELASNLTLLLVAFHFALHWDWVVRAFRRAVMDPLRGLAQLSRNTTGEPRGSRRA